MLPGLDGTGKLFQPLISALPKYLEPVVISYPQVVSLDYAALAELVRKQLPDDRFVLLAESFSGPIALAASALKPEHLVAIVLCTTFVSSPTPLPRWLSSLILRPFCLDALRRLS